MKPLLLVFIFISYAKCELSALKLAENLEQVLSSSTLEWVPVNSKQPARNFNEAVVGAHQMMEETVHFTNKMPADYAARGCGGMKAGYLPHLIFTTSQKRFTEALDSLSYGGQLRLKETGPPLYTNKTSIWKIEKAEEENSADNFLLLQPVYICRAKQNNIWVSGQVRPNDNKCVASLHGNVNRFDRYELLVNTEGAGKLNWVIRTKFIGNLQGGVTAGDETFRTFIARRNANSHDKAGSLTHFLGKFDPKDNLGKYTLVDQNDQQLEFEDGEILVETEPKFYELRNIELDYGRKRITPKPVVLGYATLKNVHSQSVARIDTVISYSYNYSVYWGHGHGLLTGLNLTIQPPSGPIFYGQWGITNVFMKIGVEPIITFLAPETAVNVTLRANYDEWDTPYTAYVVSYYKDGEQREHRIKDNQRELTLRDIIPEFGPAYFLHNQTFVPTATTTTVFTTTATTTISKLTTTSTTEELTIRIPPQIVTEYHIPDEDSIQNLDDQNILVEKAESLKDKQASDIKNTGGGVSSISFTTTLLVLQIICVYNIT